MTFNLLTEQSSDPNSILPLYFNMIRPTFLKRDALRITYNVEIKWGLQVYNAEPQVTATSATGANVKLFKSFNDVTGMIYRPSPMDARLPDFTAPYDYRHQEAFFGGRNAKNWIGYLNKRGAGHPRDLTFIKPYLFSTGINAADLSGIGETRVRPSIVVLFCKGVEQRLPPPVLPF